MNTKHLLPCLLALAPPFLCAEVAQQAYLKASNTDPVVDHPFVELLVQTAETYGDSFFPIPDLGEWFGSAVAVSGDTAVVGAPQEHSGSAGVNGDQSDDSVLSAGAAYVFIRIGTTWTQQAYLKASNPVEGAAFGRSVSISGDTIVIGAPGESGASTGVNGDQNDQAATYSGAAYVFVRSGTTWTQEAYLKASNTDSSDKFGSAVAIDGDLVVVGAPDEASAIGGPSADQTDNSAEEAGAAYLFRRSGTTWAQVRYLKAPNAEGAPDIFGDGDQFGAAVAISSETVVIGAPGEDSAATGVGGDQTDNSELNSGAAYVFRKLPTANLWVLQAYLKASNTDGEDNSWNPESTADRFGSSVALDGDLLAVGAPDEDGSAAGVNGDQSDNSSTHAGAAYVFSRSGTVWTQAAYLKASNPGYSDQFGSALALSGTILVVGAPAESSISTGIDGPEDNDYAIDAGACYVFEKPASRWSQTHYLKPSFIKQDAPSAPGYEDPCAVDLSGLSGWGTSSSGSESEPDPNLIASFDKFGSAIAIDGTILFAGSPYEDSAATGVDGNETNSGAPNSGAVYAFDLDAQPPIPQGDLALQHPVGRDLASQASEVEFGLVGVGLGGTLTFGIANVGGADLTGVTISVAGPHAADFTPSLTNPGTLPAGTSNTFTVTFAPSGPDLRGASLSIASSDIDENPFTIDLRGIGVGQNSDQDGDGMTDLAEWKLRYLGFDWRQRQTGLVSYYYNNAQAAGLYTQSQVATLHAPEPLLGPGSSEGKLTLTMDWKISDDLQNFVDLPASPGEISLTPQGDIKFEFDVPGDRAFFRVLIGE